ncbi:protease inhibitor I42 family protein [Chitinibacter tainanensis]|uniref:protease inhibitor I42 family protein n=1 Tax=Chitinibacter tainanensis TaxID=230667 RepID=UPI00042774A5|nr:protease inhibitor I42 family protein [Chitinibacter tainanensis]
MLDLRRPLGSLLLASLCASPVAMAEQLVTQLEHQQEIKLQPRETLTVKLPSSPSTGYLWFYEPPAAAPLTMTQDWKFIPRDLQARPVIGDTIWRFQAKDSGEATLRFVYRKPWQGGETEPLDVREYRIVVQEKNAGS